MAEEIFVPKLSKYARLKEMLLLDFGRCFSLTLEVEGKLGSFHLSLSDAQEIARFTGVLILAEKKHG